MKYTVKQRYTTTTSSEGDVGFDWNIYDMVVVK